MDADPDRHRKAVERRMNSCLWRSCAARVAALALALIAAIAAPKGWPTALLGCGGLAVLGAMDVRWRHLRHAWGAALGLWSDAFRPVLYATPYLVLAALVAWASLQG